MSNLNDKVTYLNENSTRLAILGTEILFPFSIIGRGLTLRKPSISTTDQYTIKS